MSYIPATDQWVFPIIALFLGNTILFFVVQLFCKRDNSWIDCMWGLSFAIPNAVIWALRGGDEITSRMVLITVPVFLWSSRLAIYIWMRHRSEDYRYKEMRDGWEKNGDCGYYTRAYCYVYVMQGFFSLINNSSVLFVNLYSNKLSKDLQFHDFIGLGVWALGFLIELMADAQLASHLKNPKPGTTKFIKSGLWRYSRHPNYFGEAVMWWGIYIIAIGEDMGWVTFFSALFITLIIRFVSGVPFPEKKYANNEEWQAYSKETNVFCLWFYKENKGMVHKEMIL